MACRAPSTPLPHIYGDYATLASAMACSKALNHGSNSALPIWKMQGFFSRQLMVTRPVLASPPRRSPSAPVARTGAARRARWLSAVPVRRVGVGLCVRVCVVARVATPGAPRQGGIVCACLRGDMPGRSRTCFLAKSFHRYKYAVVRRTCLSKRDVSGVGKPRTTA